MMCRNTLKIKKISKKDYFNFPIVNFPFSCSNIPAAPAYGVCFSPSILYSKICGFYDDLLPREVTDNKEATEPRIPSG